MKQVTNILISFLLVFSIYSCKEDTKIIVPAVEIAGADAGPTTLSFYIAHAGATSGAYLCLPEEQTLPSTAAEVLESGKSLEMDKQDKNRISLMLQLNLQAKCVHFHHNHNHLNC